MTLYRVLWRVGTNARLSTNVSKKSILCMLGAHPAHGPRPLIHIHGQSTVHIDRLRRIAGLIRNAFLSPPLAPIHSWNELQIFSRKP